jgi:hypothetical protein
MFKLNFLIKDIKLISSLKRHDSNNFDCNSLKYSDFTYNLKWLLAKKVQGQ